MPTISTAPRTPRTTIATTAATPTTAATKTTKPAATKSKAAEVVGDPKASGASSLMRTTALDGGYGRGIAAGYDKYARAGQNVGALTGGAGKASELSDYSGYERGAIEVAAARIDDKHFAVEVATLHSGGLLKGKDDALTMFVETKVQGLVDGAPAEAIIRLATPFQGAANNVDRFHGKHSFTISYADLDAALKAHHPQLGLFDDKGAFKATGATIAVRATWANGHNWGGYGRLGVVEVPTPAAKTTATAVQARNIASSSVKIAASEMPLDLEHVLPAAVQQQFPKVFSQAKPVKVSTRLERELKGKVDTVQQHEAAVVRMHLLAAGYKPLVDELKTSLVGELMTKVKMKRADARDFADKLTIAPHTAWAVTDDKGRFVESKRLGGYGADADKLVAAGIVKTKAEATTLLTFMKDNTVTMHEPLPLEDKYSGARHEMEKSVIRRVRSNALAEGIYNVKPGPGRLQADVEPSTSKEACGLIRARIEASLELKDKNVRRSELDRVEMADGSPFNVIGSLLKEAGVYVDGMGVTYMPADLHTKPKPVTFTMMQERHRFDIEVDGMKLDTSIDFVEVDDKGKKVTRQVVEMELEHKFIEAPKAATSTTTPSANTSAVAPTLQSEFADLAAQQRTVARFDDVTLNVPPRFHKLSDLDDAELWQTREQLASNAVTNALIGLLYPHGVQPCEQKGVEMARALGKLGQLD